MKKDTFWEEFALSEYRTQKISLIEVFNQNNIDITPGIFFKKLGKYLRKFEEEETKKRNRQKWELLKPAIELEKNLGVNEIEKRNRRLLKNIENRETLRRLNEKITNYAYLIKALYEEIGFDFDKISLYLKSRHIMNFTTSEISRFYERCLKNARIQP